MSSADSQNWIAVCTAEDLAANVGVCAKVDDSQIALFKLNNGQLYAISNHDPFSNANVLSRGIVGDLKGKFMVASPIYKQHFDLETGICLEDASVHIPVYPIRDHNGKIEIAIS